MSVKNLQKIVASKIRAHRKDANLTQQMLADKIQISRSTIANMENGRQELTLENLYRLVHVLKIELKDILPSVDNIFPKTDLNGIEFKKIESELKKENFSKNDREKIIGALSRK